MALDPFAPHPVKSLVALGSKALPQLLDVIERRADADDVDVACICARMPPAWQATMLMAYAVSRFEAGEPIGDVLRELGADAAGVVIAAFSEIGESEIAGELGRVDHHIDYETDGDDDDADRSNEGPPDADALARARKKLTVLLKGMDAPFPAADARFVRPPAKAAGSKAQGRPGKAQRRQDPLGAVLPEEILALGDDAVATLVAVVEERAGAHERSFEEEARDLPDRWRVLIFAAAAVDGLLECGSFAGALWNITRAKEIEELRTFFDDIEQPDLAFAFGEAREFAAALARGVDPEDIAELRELVDLDELDVRDVRRALTQAAAAISKPFPTAE